MQNFGWKRNSRKFADCSLKNVLMSYAYESHKESQHQDAFSSVEHDYL